MILADKIIKLRKKNGWSQEELAEKMNVSRQAVSKWEGAQTVPDLEKILQLSSLFGVTTDYLLKDEIEDEQFTDDSTSSLSAPEIQRISLPLANEFLKWRQVAAVRIALATFLCILSVIPLIILAAASETPAFNISEAVAVSIGLVILIVTVAAAVAIFVVCGLQNEPYAFIDKAPFELEYGVRGMVQERQKAYRKTYIKFNTIATVLCVLSPVSLFIGAFSGDGFLEVVMLAITVLIAGIGVMLYILAGVRQASMQKLLREGDFTPEAKKKSRVMETVGFVYWMSVTAIYLALLFISTPIYAYSWAIWPIAGVLFAAVMVICNQLTDKKTK
ncbi:MAG: helix-turn-helix transcriptional regulator [Clostridia bacterium]|nr:helix-turn-helix transcriptional regulator [Clostridia bacterium]